MKTHIPKPIDSAQPKKKTKGASLAPPPFQRKENKTGMSDQLKSGIENLSGTDMSDVKVHYSSSQPAQLNAHAYAQGSQIHVAPGQEKHLPHEAWHVVQQKQGRVKPTMQMKGKVNINDDEGLEAEADVMGEKAMQMKESTPKTLVYLKEAGHRHFPAQLRKKEASRFISGNNLDVKATYEDILEYVRNPSNPDLMRTGLKDAWNHLQSAHFQISDLAEPAEVDKVQKAFVEKASSKALAKYREPKLNWQAIKTMYGFLTRLGVDLSIYKVPLDLAGAGKMMKEIAAFNGMLDRIAFKDIFTGPFVVNIRVGDLKGYGDIMAGAKLARELAVFYHRFEQWRNVNVRLYLAKVENLQEELSDHKGAKESGASAEIKKIIAMVQRVMGGARVNITGVNDEVLAEAIPSVNVAYPVPGIGGDILVGQYGHNRLEHEYGHGSGPGFGSLGTLPVPAEKQLGAIRALANSESPLVDAIHKLEERLGITHFHFGYFSIYEKRPKEFAQYVSDNSAGTVIGIAIAKSMDKAENMATSLSSKGHNVEVFTILKDGTTTKVGETRAKVPTGKKIVLIDLPEGADNQDMLSLYFKSNAPAGATGDQSFMEAYTMQHTRQMFLGEEESPEIMYDVSEQQVGLYHHLGELHSRSISPQKGALGLRPLKLRQDVDQIILQKNLLFPLLMLINEALHEK